MSGQLYILATLTPYKSTTDTQCLGGQADPRFSLGVLEERKISGPPGRQTTISQSLIHSLVTILTELSRLIVRKTHKKTVLHNLALVVSFTKF